VVGLAVLVALVTAVMLASVAGARRNHSVVDRFLEATSSRDIGGFVITLGRDGVVDGPELATSVGGRLRALEGVTGAGVAVGYPTAASPEFDVTVVASPDDSQFRTIDRPVLLAGRLPSKTADEDEVAINDATADLLGVDIGDTVSAPTFSPEDCAALAADQFDGFNGPFVDLHVVGRIRVGDDLRGDEATSGPIALASPRFIDRHGADMCATVAFAALRTGPGGPGVDEVQSALDEETVGLQKGLVSTVEDDFARTAELRRPVGDRRAHAGRGGRRRQRPGERRPGDPSADQGGRPDERGPPGPGPVPSPPGAGGGDPGCRRRRGGRDRGHGSGVVGVCVLPPVAGPAGRAVARP
jgi:hypothetical protein